MSPRENDIQKAPNNENSEESKDKFTSPLVRASVGILAMSLTYGYINTGRQLEEYKVEQPYSPIKVGAAYADHFSKLPYSMFNIESCPASPSQEDIDAYLTADYNQTADRPTTHELGKRNNLSLPILELHNYNDLYKDIQNATSLQEITEIISALTEAHLGVTVSQEGLEDYSGFMPEIALLRRQAMNLTSDIITTPKEVFSATGVDTIRIRPLAQESADDSGVVTAGSYTASSIPLGINPSIDIDINSIGDDNLFNHELLGHGMHFTACDNFPASAARIPRELDSTIHSFNPENFIYDEARGQSFDEEYDHHTTVSGYAEMSEKEDVAEITAQLITGELQIGPDLVGTPLGQKVGTILHRLDQEIPGLSDYYLSRSQYIKIIQLSEAPAVDK